ncbi:hypothetical protein [Methylophilus sp. OH31]|uniref:hypothetical protein n=1 Tax=Methylophilus sp. OH31 TaxID=1387312 RepID=UPI00046707D7|nr:hypothetical protein [Methylophilus sp. OH31]
MFTILLRCAVSVISLCLMCKPVFAEDESSLWEGFRIGGYTSVDLHVPRTEPTRLNWNELSMIVTWDKNTRIKFFGELDLENVASYTHAQGLDFREAYINPERLYFDVNLHEKANLRIGRFLTPLGRWNQLHASPLVWTTSRPLATTELFPSFTSGLQLFGNLPFKERSLDYQVYTAMMNSQPESRGETQYKDAHGARIAINNILNLSDENAGLNTVGLNVSSYRDEKPNGLRYRLVGLDFLLEFDRWELSGETYTRKAEHGQNGGSGSYLQSAFLIKNDWYWITRLESLHQPDSRDAERWVLGVTKRLKPNQLLKFEIVGGSGEYEDVPRGFATSFAMMY